ncbi:M14 family zinc carboxypeptidase [Streptomyces noursei]|uniref:M14 family zinc carboxypeptidase n=1 Tax=Streptomyces noursei TaxID=1971 RepID=UPI003328BCC7
MTTAAAAMVLALTALSPMSPSALARAPQRTDASGERTLVVYRVPTHDRQDAQKLISSGFDLIERRQGDDLFVMGDPSTATGLRRLGFTPTAVETMQQPPAHQPRAPRATGGGVDDTYDGGYHTVDAHYAHLDQVAAQHPDMAKVVTYGQSWLKQKGRGGRDLKAICLTKMKQGDCQLDPKAPKPRFFLMSQIHARELTTGEVSWRWIDTLTNDYGKDPKITALMDSTEMWVVPITNPDGVDIVAQGGDDPILQRKNADDAKGNCGANGQIGVDLNRNAGTHWGGAGTSTQPCSEIYRGPAADSEPENAALEGLFRKLYPAVRTGTGDSDPAPATAKGLMISLHSDASMVLLPWEADHTLHTGNDAALRALAGRLGSLTGYQSGQAGEILYDASGGTDDWTYDKLGLASFTIEIGDSDGRGCAGFTPDFSCQDSYFWPKLKPALLYAAQQAAAPYRTSAKGH